MDAEAFHCGQGARQGAIAHDPRQHVGAFRRQRDEIPERIVSRGGLRDLVVGFGLHGMDEVRKLVGVLDEEHRHVVADQIPHALLSVELHGEAAHVAGRVGRTTRTRHRREAHEDGRLDLGVAKDLRTGQLGEVFIYLKHAVRRRTARMYHALRNALMVEMRDLLTHQYVFEESGTPDARLQRVLVVADRDALVGRQHVARRHRIGLDGTGLGRLLPRRILFVERRVLPCRTGRGRGHRWRNRLFGHGAVPISWA